MDHEATAMMKAQFMSLWDGLDTAQNSQVTRHAHVGFIGHWISLKVLGTTLSII